MTEQDHRLDLHEDRRSKLERASAASAPSSGRALDIPEPEIALLPFPLFLQDRGKEGRSFQARVLTPTQAFEFAIDRLGGIAEDLNSLALSSAMAVAQIEAEGDRIDRLNAENQKRLDDLLAGKW